MPHLRSRAKAAAAAASPSSPPAGVPQGTPAPSPSTSLRLGLGPASPDDDGFGLKSPAAAPPRRSLRLAGGAAAAGTPNTPAARDGGSSGSGSGGSVKRTGRARARASASSPSSASPRDGNSGSDGGGAGTDGASAGGGPDGAVPFMSLRSGSRIAKRRMEAAGAQADGEAGPGSSAGGGQVHDGMLRRAAGAPTKRQRSILVGGVETEYVADSESDSDEDSVMLGQDGVKMPVAQVRSGPSEVELNAAAAMNMDMIEVGARDDPAKAGNGEPTDNLVWKEVVCGVIEQLSYPVGSASSPEAERFADMYFKEELGQYNPRKEGNVKEKLVLGNNNSRADANVGSQVGTSSRRFGTDSKGKGKMAAEDSLSSLNSSEDEFDSEPVNSKERVVEDSSSSLSSSEDEPDSKPVDSKEIQNNSGSVAASASASMEPLRRQAARERAIRLAPKFAFFKADKDEHSEDDEEEELEPGAAPQDWPGPFATAARIYEEREAKLRARELNSSKVDKSANKAIVWSPSKDKRNPFPARAAPSLTSLCLNTLAEHSEGIESLGGIPEELKHKLLKILCHSRRMNTHLLNELMCDSPTELHLSECSWLSDDDFEKTFGKCNTDSLQDLQLDISGRCMPDYILPTTLAKAPNCMPLLRKISLKGNYRLSDNGLDTIISAAPSLSSLNLCQCSLLTSSGIVILADKLHSVLRELYIDDCTNVEAMTILPALQKINHLEVLSMSGIQSVCDKFVNELIPVHGSNMKELAFAGCLKLTSSSIKTIGENCPQLISLDLRNLNRLRDSAMRHLRNGCRLIRKLKLQRNTFSDEAMSRYLEESGGCLTELMLNSVEKVGDLTALAISRKCSVRLEALDLSFCRQLTNEALGLIADSCPSLRILKLFGCTQITDFFLKGHSNTSVKIIGIEGSILEQIDSR
ncbi:hypothetical protein SEVIR_6G179200v4 [Setaria viridis]|uniref:F-box/LRR-repeat protein 15-like leucin rich repeat domain-containing protein n=2 Tax=Setaria TaxID=4554 RepID=K3YG54_SETIT|nr:uncharacterized protein LOC101779780 [Setaria italica]XP_034599738.1 uncharacterized protein LOC117860534 [Setaria viridis]RCV31394.1 hypothetical protein SETIT_6G173400v2 [Setaria italica]TKW10644.1 hypothetical protein SEVIR_6G179200v2 [Setaria viridis]